MLMNIFAIVILMGGGYLGFTRGFYTMLLQFGAVIAGGALALAFWEPLAYWLLNDFPDSQWIADSAWGLALAVPFGIITAILIGVQAALLRNNVKIYPMADYIGGGVLGVATAIIVGGFTVLSLSFTRGHADYTGFSPVVAQSNGSLKREENLWVPVDVITAGLFKHLSTHSLYIEDNLNRFYPDFENRPFLMGSTPENATLKLGVPDKAVDFLGRYTLGVATALKYDELVTDSLDTRRQIVTNLDGEDLKTLNNGQYFIEGYIVNLRPAAREKMGQVAVGAGHLTLLMWDRDTDETIAIQPFAMVSQTKPDPTKPLSVRFSRWRFDAKGTFLGSVGGATDSTPMAFEFLVPKRATNFVPLALYAKGIRIDLIDPSTQQPFPAKESFKSVAERDVLVASGGLIEVIGGDKLNAENATQLTLKKDDPNSGIAATNQMPFSIVLNKGDLNIPTDDKNRMMDGEQNLTPQQLNNRGIDRDLRVDRFTSSNETACVQIEVSKDSPLSFLLPTAAEATGAPVLISADGQRFSCIGFVYRDDAIARIRYSPSRPIDSKEALPSLTMSRSDQKLRLIFNVTIGAQITQYAIGDKVIATFNPPLAVTEVQR
jgi:hypothetical protein